MVLLFGLENWVLTAAMLQKIEGVYVDFLRKVTGMKSRRMEGNTWQKEGMDRVIQVAGNKPLR